jgi:hypothetical protein
MVSIDTDSAACDMSSLCTAAVTAAACRAAGMFTSAHAYAAASSALKPVAHPGREPVAGAARTACSRPGTLHGWYTTVVSATG